MKSSSGDAEGQEAIESTPFFCPPIAPTPTSEPPAFSFQFVKWTCASPCRRASHNSLGSKTLDRWPFLSCKHVAFKRQKHDSGDKVNLGGQRARLNATEVSALEEFESCRVVQCYAQLRGTLFLFMPPPPKNKS